MIHADHKASRGCCHLVIRVQPLSVDPVQRVMKTPECILHEQENGPRQRERLVRGLGGNSERLLCSTFIFCSGESGGAMRLDAHTHTLSAAPLFILILMRLLYRRNKTRLKLTYSESRCFILN